MGSMSVKPGSKLVTPVGNSSALSTESSQTDKCHLTRPSEVVMMPSTPSSLRLVLESTSQDVSSSISNQPSSMRSELVPTDNSSTQNNLFLVKKTLPTTSPEVITPLVKKSSISASTESENSLTNVLVSKVSSSSTLSAVVPDPVLVPSSSRDSLSITARSPSLVSPSTHLPKSPPLLLSHTTPSSPLTLFLSIPMSLSCLTTKPSTISAEEPLILRDPPTPTSTDSSPRSSPPLPPPSDSMVPSTSISLSSRPTSSPTPESISCFPLTPPSSPPRKLTTSNSPSLRSPTPPSSPPP